MPRTGLRARLQKMKNKIVLLALSETDLEKKIKGTLRKGCPGFGHARQPERRVNTTLKLARLREVLRHSTILKELPIDAYIVTSTDEHQNSEIEVYEKRRQYISGFSGSYGDIVVTQNVAALWTDGRYHLQADEQLDCNWLLFREGHRGVPKMSQWLKKNMTKNSLIGLNPKLVSEHMWNKLESDLNGTSLRLVELKVNPIDIIWPSNERGSRQNRSSFIVGMQYTGKNYTTKINETRKEIKRLGANAMVITALDEISWLLNIRGRDVPFSPFLRSYVILDMRDIFMYVNISKLNKETIKYLHADTKIVGKDSVILHDYDAFWDDLKTKSQLYDKILVPSHCVYSEGASHEVYKHILPEKRLPRQSPIIHLKAVKNSVEIKAMREANILDATAVCDCLAYIENKVADDQDFILEEKDLVQYLDEYRYEQYRSFGNSFRTVAAFGPNAAYPKYEPTPNTNVKIFRNSTVMLYSGGQYYGGTTVVTRTVHFGEPTEDMKDAYTRVLIGLIQLSSLAFPNNTKMAIVDALARASLWEVGLDYEQETGHGIGAFLGTHESPIQIHYDSKTSMHQVFKPGFFLTSGVSLALSDWFLQKTIKGTLRLKCVIYADKQLVRRVNTTSRITRLREVMRDSKTLKEWPIDAYIVTSTDEHQNTGELEEYEKRHQYISGFSGSYGNIVVTEKAAALWTDSRYHLQADEQLDCNWLLFREGYRGVPKMSQWLKENMRNNSKIGLDPKLVSEHMWNELESDLNGSSLHLVELTVNPIDIIWPSDERPSRQNQRSFVEMQYTGKSYMTKINETRKEIERLGGNAMVITALDEISWLLNIRGRDVPFSPFLRSYVILDMSHIFMYFNHSELNHETKQYLHGDTKIVNLQLHDYNAFWDDLKFRSKLYDKILVPSHCGVYSEGASHEVYKHIPPKKRLPRQSPIIHLKGVKNCGEKNPMREANILDATAVCDCLAYIEKKVADDQDFVLEEKDLVKYLDEYRYEQYSGFGKNFTTVAAFGPNDAYQKYEPTSNTNIKIFRNNTVMLYSGGQYYGGTTVVTRTVHFGEPTEDMKDAYTRVLKGLIQLSSLTFPNNTKMAVVDALVRASMWEIGLDYEQETGHVLGASLGTDESPIQIHYDSKTSMHEVFKPGSFLTSAPRFYSAGHFGVRLENMLEVYEKRWLERSTGHKFLGFKTITLIPFEMKLIKLSLLSTQQRKWLNEYNKQIRELVGAQLKSQNRMDGFYWMMDRTKYVREHGNSDKIINPLLLIITTTALTLKTYIL